MSVIMRWAGLRITKDNCAMTGHGLPQFVQVAHDPTSEFTRGLACHSVSAT